MDQAIDQHLVLLPGDLGLEGFGDLGHDRRSLVADLMPSILHELIQPLAALMVQGTIGARALAGDRCIKQTAVEALDRSTTEARRAARLVESLSLLVRPSLSTPAHMSVNELVERAADLMRQELNERGCTLDLVLADGLPPIFASAGDLLDVILRTVVATARGNDPCRFVMTVTTRLLASGRIEIAFLHDGGFPASLQSRFESCPGYGAATRALHADRGQITLRADRIVVEVPTNDPDISPLVIEKTA